MGGLRAQFCFQGAGGQAKDQWCNTFNFTTINELLLEGDGEIIDGAIRTFFSALNVSGDSCMSSVVENAPATTKIYNYADPKPRPIAFESFQTPSYSQGSGHPNFPNEVAVCLSYKAAPVAGAIRARNRGRIYIGPLCSTAADVGAGNNPVVSGGFVTSLLAAAVAMRATLFAANIVWCIYSPTSHNQANPAALVDDFMFPIDSFSVDNEFDTQRRRGVKATTRQQQSV